MTYFIFTDIVMIPIMDKESWYIIHYSFMILHCNVLVISYIVVVVVVVVYWLIYIVKAADSSS